MRCLLSIIKFYQRKIPGQARNDSTLVGKRFRNRISKINTAYDLINEWIFKSVMTLRCHTGLDPVPFSITSFLIKGMRCLLSIIKFYQRKIPGRARNDSTPVGKRLRNRISKINTTYDLTNEWNFQNSNDSSMSYRAVIATASEAKQEARPGVFFYNQFVD